MFAKNYQAKSTFSISWPQVFALLNPCLAIISFAYVAHKHSWMWFDGTCDYICLSMQEGGSHANTLFVLYKVGVRTTNITARYPMRDLQLDSR
jgi:hypothetical protein